MTTTQHRRRLSPFSFLLLACCSCLAACATGPDPLDVQADRDRWTAFRDATADGRIDEREAPLVAELFVVWDQKLTAAEAAANRARAPRDVWAEVLRVYGEAAVQVALMEVGWPAIAAQHPDAFRLVDRDGDGRLTVSELQAVDPLSPVFAMVVTQTAVQMLRRKP
ncbi:MAG: EF-hand domain-containing protein [Planctomycetota bacterium]